jgi:organic hydroperoxide reductase OsmC/OhrA
MLREHHFNTLITWTGNIGSGTMDYRSYERDFTLHVEGKPDIKGSSASTFLGDDTAHNPEDLLLASVASCHMLWYLHLCAENNIVVLEYRDNASAILSEQPDGSGHFSKITLHPEVVINASGNVELANQLHAEANKMCFIANTLKCPVEHIANCKVSE